MGVLRRVWAELGPRESALVVLAALGLVLVTADVLAGGLATYVDEQVSSAVGVSGEAASGDGWTGSVGSLSSVGEIGLSGGILIIVVLVTVQATFRLWPLVVAAGNVGGGLLLVLALKLVTGRVGPGESTLPEGYPGFFPSGHTATAGLCLGTACFVLLRWRGTAGTGGTGSARRMTPDGAGLLVGCVVAALVGLGTVLGGYHWLTDAVGGLLVTVLVLPLGFAACAAYAVNPDDVRREDEPGRRPPPQA